MTTKQVAAWIEDVITQARWALFVIGGALMAAMQAMPELQTSKTYGVLCGLAALGLISRGGATPPAPKPPAPI